MKEVLTPAEQDTRSGKPLMTIISNEEV